LSNKRPILKKIIAQTASIWLVLLLVLVGSSLFAQTGIIAGLKYSDGPVQEFLGGIHTYNEHISIVGTAEVMDDGQSYALHPVVTFHIFDKLYLGGLVGPQVETVELEPSEDQKITYLMASSGFILAYKLDPKFLLWAGYDHQFTDKITDNYSIFFGVVSYFH
jgi:hypothetical protein